jgi:predicted transglutaminase-like cysteine proteinase
MKTRLIVFLAAVLALMMSVSTGAQAASPKQCGGIAGLQCGADQFCQKKPGTCAVIDMSGTCVGVPKFCPRHVLPVCGCDGKTYNNDCERQQAKVSLAHKGKCM